MFELRKEKTALAVVDMQNDFVREGAGMRVEDTLKTIDPIKRLIDFARESNMPVIYTRFIAGPKRTLLWNWSPQIADCNACVWGVERYYPDVDKTLPVIDVIDELRPNKWDYIVDKYWYSAFVNTHLPDILLNEGRDTLIFTGTVTQICVADSVHGAFSQGINAVVASDCVSSFAQDLHDAALKNIDMKYGVVLSSEEIIEKLN